MRTIFTRSHAAEIVEKLGKFFFLSMVLVFWGCSGDNGTALYIEELNPENPSNGESRPDENSSDASAFVNSPVILSELDPINVSYKDHEGDDAGWVELYNRSDSVVRLNGYALTDNKSSLQKWIFGNVSMAPKSYLLVFLSGKDLKDYQPPSDSINLVGHGCWTWTDAQSTPIPGYSKIDLLPGKLNPCFQENGKTVFGGTMQFAENKELGWHSISFFVGTKSSSKTDVLDLSKTNELLITGYVEKSRTLQLNLAQPDLDDWKGWGKTIVGTGDSTTTYNIPMPTGTTFPDLSNIYGTRFWPEDHEVQPVAFKIRSYIARNRGHEPHANFKVEKKSGKLYLVDKNKAIADSTIYASVPVGKTWTRDLSAGGNVWGFADPSPYSKTLTKIETTQANAPSASLPPSGFYSGAISINFSAEQHVRCEEEGYEPTVLSPLVTTKSIVKTTVLRCASFVPNALPSTIETRTYVFENQPKMPVVFLTGNPKSLFDPDTGIYMDGNYAQESSPHYGANYWADREIPIHVELFEKGARNSAFSKNAGLKIFGNYSRANAKKSVSVVFREKYGDNKLNYMLFPDFPALKKFKVFLLRNNGGNFGSDYIRDRLCSSVTEGLGLDYQRGRGSVVYYNGEYYGIHNIRERSTEYYFETHYGLNPDEIDLLKADNSATAGSSVEYVDLMNWLETHHLDSKANYDYVANKIDVDNFINYVQTEIFMNNRDWPANNLKKWRGTNPKTKWKWFVYDMDFGFGNEFTEYKNNVFDFVTEEHGSDWPNGPASTLLLRRLLENNDFKQAFVNRMTTLLSMNFEKSRLLNRIESMMSEIESEVARDQQRWHLSSAYMDSQLGKIKSFAGMRQSVVMSEMVEHFALGERVSMTLSVQGPGKILVQELPLDRSSMKIEFFNGTPVILTAQANGGVFLGWNDGVKTPIREIFPGEASSLTALFK